MKVIKPGRQQKGWAAELKCTGRGNGDGGCGATLLVEEGDLFQTARHCYDGSSDYFVTFACSECGVWSDTEKYPRGPHGLPQPPRKRAAQQPTERGGERHG